MDRTIRLKLHTSADDRQVLTQTVETFTTCFNTVAALGWMTGEKNGVRLHHATYYALRAKHPTLPAQLVCAARVKATEAIKSAFTRKAQGRKTGQPRSVFCPIRYDVHTYRMKWDTRAVSLSTIAGRKVFGFAVPAYAQKYIGYPVASADLIRRKDAFWLHVVVTLPEPEKVERSQIIGVDLGLNRPAVTSEKQFLGKRQWKGVDRRYFRLRRTLQAKGTRSATRHLKKLSGKVARFRLDCDHVLSKRIVQSADAGATIVIENLTDIRSHTKQRGRASRRRMHSWSYAQLRAFLSYKAEERGMHVVAVDPRHTSQMCSRCGYISRSNRKSQSLFLCGQCGYSLNADLNASYNIREKHHANVGTSFAGGLPVMQPIVPEEETLSGASPRL